MAQPLFGKPVITQEAIRRRVKSLGTKIARDYQGKDLLMIGVLKGAFMFFSDLSRAIPLPLHVDFLVVSRHRDKRRKDGGPVKIISDVSCDLKAKDVLIVEDIVDSGFTLNFLKEALLPREPASLKFCTLLDKPARRKTKAEIDYRCFVIPNDFVVGYGLDYKNKYRNLPYIASLDHVMEDEHVIEDGSGLKREG